MASLEMLSGRSKKEYAKKAHAVAEAEDGASAPTLASNGADSDPEAVVAM